LDPETVIRRLVALLVLLIDPSASCSSVAGPRLDETEHAPSIEH